MSNITFVDSYATIKFISFSDGTENCIIDEKFVGAHGSCFQAAGSHIQVIVENGTRDIIRIGLVKDALSRIGINDVKLTLGYMPQARADRVFEKGASLPIKVFADILNSYGFSKVYIYDPHSDVTTALINNVEVLSQTEMLLGKLKEIKPYLGDFTICAPDLGAAKKVFDTVKTLGHSDYIQGIKIRDVTTGNIVKCNIDKHEITGNVLIVDDISDGGASFKHTAKVLKERGADKVGLYVTHAIFTKGLDVMRPEIDFIFTSNIVGGYIKHQDIMEFNND